MSGIKRHALVIGLSDFGAAGPPKGEPEPGLRNLAFAADRSRELAVALEAFGYTVTTHTRELTAAKLGALVMDAAQDLDPNDVLLVHILSHGELTEQGVLYVIGSDGLRDKETEVEHWLKSLQDHRYPYVLFLLDLCHAGASTRTTWQLAVADGRARAWVLAACEPERKAFNGRFTQAAANVLNRLAGDDAQIADSRQHIAIDTFARLVRAEVDDLVELADGYPQQVVGSLLDISAEVPDLPFFPNRRFDPQPRPAVGPHVHSGLITFLRELDEVLDPFHFIERAEGFGAFTEPGYGLLRREHGLGCFSGRKRELRILSTWFDGQDPDSTRFRVVTGSPGAGKSALVGVLVCAAHPLLRAKTERIWKHLEPTPYINHNLAAVHARQRDLAGIVASIRSQLTLGRDEEHDGLEGFFERIRRSGRPATIVVDALDEAEKFQQVAAELLLPLSRLDRPDGTPACRLLVATRPWPEFGAVLDAAKENGGLVDLDQVPDGQLAIDLENYISELLRHQPPYQQVSHVGARQTFAAAVAAALTRTRQETEGQRWGEFLVAGLYTHHLVTSHEPVKDIDRAAQLGSDVPLTLPALLELELAARAGATWFRPLLMALAHARGDGMPVETAIRAAEVFAPEALGRATFADIISALKAARFYLRPAADTDGSMLYRLFHQGLSDYLCTHPIDENENDQRLFRALLRPIEVAGGGGRRWDLAEPYLRRHIVQHGLDAGTHDTLLDDAEFLVYADPAAVTALLTEHPLPWLTAADYRHQTGHPDDTQRTRRFGLALQALSHRESGMAERLNHPHGMVPWLWCPQWTVNVDRLSVTAADSDCLDLGPGPALVQLTKATGEALVVMATAREISCWSAEDGRVRWARTLLGPTHRLGFVSGRSPKLAVVAYGPLGDYEMWDIRTGDAIGAVIDTDAGDEDSERDPATQHVRTERGDMLVVAVPDRPEIRLYHGDGRPAGLIALDRPANAIAATASDGALVIAAAHDGEVTLEHWNLRKMRHHRGRHLGSVPGTQSLMSMSAGQHLVVVANGDTVRLWHKSRQPRPSGDITALSPLGYASAVAVGTDDGTVSFLTEESGEVVHRWRPHQSMVTALAGYLLSDNRTVVVSGSANGDVAAWDVANGAALFYQPHVHSGSVRAVAMFELSGQPRVLSLGSEGQILTDTGTGESTSAGSLLLISGNPGAVTLGQRHLSVRWDATAGGLVATDLSSGQVVENLPLRGEIRDRTTTMAGDLVVALDRLVVGLRLAEPWRPSQS